MSFNVDVSVFFFVGNSADVMSDKRQRARVQGSWAKQLPKQPRPTGNLTLKVCICVLVEYDSLCLLLIIHIYSYSQPRTLDY